MEFKGIIKERKKEIRYAITLAVCYMLFLAIRSHQWVYVLLLLLVILATFLKKEHIISEKGVIIARSVFGIKSDNIWDWSEITTLHTDYKKAKPNVMLHIGKDVVTRTFTFKPEDIPGILELAEQMNPKIYIENVSEEERDRMDQEILHRQQVLKSQKAAARRKKKK